MASNFLGINQSDSSRMGCLEPVGIESDDIPIGSVPSGHSILTDSIPFGYVGPRRVGQM